jgi:hypothetical protein
LARWTNRKHPPTSRIKTFAIEGLFCLGGGACFLMEQIAGFFAGFARWPGRLKRSQVLSPDFICNTLRCKIRQQPTWAFCRSR